MQLKRTLLTILGGLMITTILYGQSSKNQINGFLKMDMVHNNPGEATYESSFNRPDVIRSMGFNAKSYFLFDSPALAISWDRFDKDILPIGSPDREWVEKKSARIHGMFNDCKQNGIDVYAMSDLVLLPKRLIEKYHIENTFGNPKDTLTQRILRYQIQAIFHQFPQMDGLVVRIGETYLEDAPYHKGSIQNKNDADKCIIPLIQLLREEICVKLNKKLIFRTWNSFDLDAKTYESVSNAVEPDSNLIISVKHCEGDFHRGNPFSKVLGLGRHQQIVEVQCAREYEGKGAFPNYISRGVIDGFEEHQAIKNTSIRDIYKSGKLVGLWTWSRGGGWEGPYPKNELWCEMNAWILSQWSIHPNLTEKQLFEQYAQEKLKLNKESTQKLHEIALLSEHAMLRGIRSVSYSDSVMPMWVRDEYITFPVLPKDKLIALSIVADKDAAVKDWDAIVKLTQNIYVKDELTAEFVKVSCVYGQQMFRIFRSVFHLAGIKNGYLKEDKSTYINEYDNAWKKLEQLSQQYPRTCPSLYSKTIIRRTFPVEADKVINEMRK